MVSASVYAEILVRPLQNATDAVIEEFLTAAGIRVLPVDQHLARVASQLRANHPAFRLPDAMCLAAALEQEAVLLTFDEQLIKLDQHNH